ncbi:MAG: NPCBM/NEW2 domain-containing protein [Desulfobacteraceae bacterium]|jgi:Gpi18-like mannosyltransferase
MSKRSTKVVFLIFILALLVRVPLLPRKGYVGDTAWWIYWGKHAADYGIVDVYDKVWCNYPPLFVYVLGSIHKGISPYAPGTETIAGKKIEPSRLIKVCYNSAYYRIFYKLPGIFGDLVCGLLLFLFIRKFHGERWAMAVAGLFLLNPAIIQTSAYWGQVDSVYTALVFFCVWALIEKKWRILGGLFSIALLIKLQPIVLSPLLFIVTWRQGGRKAIAHAGIAFIATCTVLLFPFLAQNRMDNVIKVYSGLVDTYPNWSLYAFNFWWLIAGGLDARQLVDTIYLGNLIQANIFGFIMLSSVVAMISLKIWRLKTIETEKIITAASGLALAFFCLPTQIHERYLFMSIIFLAALLPYKKERILPYGLLSTGFFISLATAINTSYPEWSPLWWPDSTWINGISITVSLINLCIFLWILTLLIGRDRFIVLSGGFILTGGICLCSYQTLSLGREPVALTRFKPTRATQDWGNFQINRSVSSDRIWIGDLPFSTGLGTHANSRITYSLPRGKFKRLSGYIGKDDDVQLRQNNIQFLIYDQARKKLFDSGRIGRHGLPYSFSIDITDVDALSFIVNDGGDGIHSDHANWADVMLYP